MSSGAAPRVVYVVGSGHSGTTLLDLLVSAHSAAVSAGELGRLALQRGKGCVCGATPFARCPFWSGVDAALRSRGGSGLDRLDVAAAEPARFARENAALYAAIAEASGRRIVVDSSKSVQRLARLFDAGIDVLPLHLVRDPRGVVFSELRKGRSLLRAARLYRTVQRRARRLLAGRAHLALRYEELAADPAGVLGRVMRVLGLELEPGQLDWAGRQRHGVSGNQMRRASDSAIALDDAWRRGLGPGQKLLIRAITAGATRARP